MRSENSLEKSMMLGMGGGSRKRGRPRARWLDDIKAETNCTLTELCGLTRDRDAWRKMVMGITRSRPRLDGTRQRAEEDVCMRLALYNRDCVSLCLSDETLKAVGPFYMVSMPEELKDPTQHKGPAVKG